MSDIDFNLFKPDLEKIGAGVADALFKEQTGYPSGTPSASYEDAYSSAISCVTGLAEDHMAASEVRAGWSKRAARDVALDAFHQRFNALNAAYMAERGGTA